MLSRIRARRETAAFTLLELLVAVAIVSVLIVGSVMSYRWVMLMAKRKTSMENLRQLCQANHAYATDHDGRFCPAMDRRNRIRWHGGRSSSSGEFDPGRGFLSAYLGGDGAVATCPLFKPTSAESFEEGAGGYGYNAKYVGGEPGNPYQGRMISSIPNLSRTIMFATTALSREDGVQEYPFAEPFRAVSRRGNIGEPMQPSVHFRAGGKALVGWCDSHVTVEAPSDWSETNFYGGDNKRDEIGWFGPEEENGYWNPNSPAARGEARISEQEMDTEQGEDEPEAPQENLSQ